MARAAKEGLRWPSRGEIRHATMWWLKPAGTSCGCKSNQPQTVSPMEDMFAASIRAPGANFTSGETLISWRPTSFLKTFGSSFREGLIVRPKRNSITLYADGLANDWTRL